MTIKTRHVFALLSLLLAVSSSNAGQFLAFNRPVISLSSLLAEMTNRADVAQLPVYNFTCKEATSHDHRKIDPADPAGWHSNKDYEQFIRIETNSDRREWVMMEDHGPGAIVRFWTPLQPGMDDAVIRFYLDGATTPAISAKLNDLFRGCDFIHPPFAFVSWDETDLRNQANAPRHGALHFGGDIYLPIPFAKSCKITLDKLPFYYGINYRIYEPDTHVRTFTRAEYDQSAAALEQAGNALMSISTAGETGPVKQAEVAPGSELELELAGGSAAVTAIQVQVDPQAAPQVLRSTVLQATFDGEQSVWCPLGEFFGAGARLNPVQDWWRTVTTNGLLSSRWVMPYRHTARLALKNLGTKPVSLKLAAVTGNWKWDRHSLYFHANWHAQFDLPTRPRFDWNYINLKGRGMYVGDTLTVFSPVTAWYGEGDERIYVDGEKLPSHIGTGTEDYYGYAWGMPYYFNSPFMSAPQRDGPKQSRGQWRGYTTTSRLRLLDQIPFRSTLQLDMEIWDWADTQLDYAVGSFWYAHPGTTNNRPPQPDQAAALLREVDFSAKP